MGRFLFSSSSSHRGRKIVVERDVAGEEKGQNGFKALT